MNEPINWDKVNQHHLNLLDIMSRQKHLEYKIMQNKARGKGIYVNIKALLTTEKELNI